MEVNYNNNMPYSAYNDNTIAELMPPIRSVSPAEVPSTMNAAVAAAAVAAVGSIPTSASASLPYTYPSMFPQTNYLPAYNNNADINTHIANNITGFDNNVYNRLFPRQASSTGSTSPLSGVSSSSSTSASPAQQFASISANSPPAPTVPTPFASPTYGHRHHSRADYKPIYSWALPRYAPGMHPADFYGPPGSWWSQYTGYTSYNFEDIAYQSSLQRRPQRCSCPNCCREMNGLPPIVGPDERGRKQHICPIPPCTRHYSKASHLRTHLRWHTGERPYPCHVCTKRFARSDELQRHLRVHTNHRPYKCPMCAKCFSRSDHLSKHKKTHDKLKKGKKAQSKQQAKAHAQATQLQSAGGQPQVAQNIKQEPTDRLIAGIASASVSIRTHAEETSVSVNFPAIPSATGTAAITASANVSATTEQANPMRLPQQQNGYPNLYHQNTYGGLYQTSDLSQQQSSSLELWNQHYRQQQCNSFGLQQQQQTLQQNAANVIATASNNFPASTTSATAAGATPISNNQQSHQQQQQQLNTSSISANQHFASLAMQSETHQAGDYGLSLSTSASSSNYMQNGTPTVAPYLGGLSIKSENSGYSDYASTYNTTWNMH